MNNEPTASGEPSHKAEPVAWMFQGAFDISTYVSFEKPNPDIYPNPTPLYTHPHPDNLGLALSIIDQQKLEIERLKAKTLTDEEIEIIVDEVINNLPPDDLKGKHSNFYRLFARAILKKAQEK